jgi:hypothetical protein
VRTLLPHPDDDEAGLQFRVTVDRLVDSAQHGANGLPQREPGEGMNGGRVAELEQAHPVPVRLGHDVPGDPSDVFVELSNPERIVKLVEVGEERARFSRLQLEQPLHLGEGGNGIEAVVLHEPPGGAGGDGAVDVLVQLRLADPIDVQSASAAHRSTSIYRARVERAGGESL